MASGGVAAAVDLAAPLAFLSTLPERPRVLASGPMVTAVGGYPTQSWGRDGYGLECARRRGRERGGASSSPPRARGVIKVPRHDPALDDAARGARSKQAHARALKVAAHALTDDEAARAAAAGVDVLAHTPVEPLSRRRSRLWSRPRRDLDAARRSAASKAAVANLRALRDGRRACSTARTSATRPTDGIDAKRARAARRAAGSTAAAILDGDDHRARGVLGSRRLRADRGRRRKRTSSCSTRARRAIPRRSSRIVRVL